MKKLLFILLALLVNDLAAQDTGRPMVFANQATITIDSSETVKVWLGLYGIRGSGEKVGFGTSSINPANMVQWTGDLEFNFDIDSSATSIEFDSLAMYVIELNHLGQTKGDTLFADWENNTVSADSTVEYIDWIPYNRTGAAHPLFSINLTGKLAPSFGLEIGFIQAAADSNGTGNGMVSIITLNTSEVK